MGEIKQTNFRINQDAADTFRKFCEDNGMNQAQGFDHVMEIFELNRAKSVIPERRTEIEDFERLAKGLVSSYLRSVEINAQAEERIRENFTADLTRKDRTIDDLRAKIDILKAEKESAKAEAAAAIEEKEQAKKDAEAAEKIRLAAEQTAADKQIIAETLATKLAEAERKASEYDDLKASMEASEATRRVLEQQVKDIKRDALEEAKEASREAEKATEKAVREASDKLMEKIEALKDELRTARSEAETIRTKSESDIKELRAKATHDLESTAKDAALDKMKALGEAEKEIARLKAKVEMLEAQLAEAKAEKTKEA